MFNFTTTTIMHVSDCRKDKIFHSKFRAIFTRFAMVKAAKIDNYGQIHFGIQNLYTQVMSIYKHMVQEHEYAVDQKVVIEVESQEK